MREFKFRAWDKVKGKMLYLAKTQGKHDTAFFYPIHYLSLTSDSYCFMQWTGLKDKNGKDIYEGDIINYDEYCGVIVWLDFYSQFVIQNTEDYGDKKKCEQESINEYKDEIEVIGNIFKNKELLE